jgi:hypothetical protein
VALVDKYFPKIESNLKECGAKAELGKPLLLVGQSTLYDRLKEEDIRKELEKVRNEFLIEAKKVQEESIATIKADLEREYEEKLQQAYRNLDNSRRVINIQNAIFAKFFEQDKEAFLTVVKDLDEEDLEILASGGKPIS